MCTKSVEARIGKEAAALQQFFLSCCACYNSCLVLLSRSLTSIVLKTIRATSNDVNLQSDQYSFLFSESLKM